MKDLNALREFRNDASQSKPSSVKELIETGATYWYRGCAIDAPDKVIALRMETGISIQFNEEDVLDIKKEDGLYHVQVKEGTNLLASFQMTAQVNGNLESCGCKEDSNEKDEKGLPVKSRSMSNSSLSNDLGFEDIFQAPRLGFYYCYNEPYLTQRCFIYRDKCGILRRYCIPYWASRQICRWV